MLLSNINAALGFIDQLQEHLLVAAKGLANRCTVAGKLDNRLLDEQQIPSYELALASADLTAAQCALAACSEKARRLDQNLALVFATQAITTVIAQLELLFIDLEIALTPLRKLSSSPEWSELRSQVLSTQMHIETAQLMQAANGEFSAIAMSEDLQLAQDSFRRFAAEKVAPVAQALHRENAVIPEALLQPLRDMGVFGLSIPERFGGSAPNDRDDTALMVAVTEALSEGSLVAGSLITRPEILSRALLAGGTQEQQSHWLPKLAIGKPLCAISITEPDFGSDVASLMLKAHAVDGGWVLNGAKTWCTFAGKAGVLMVVVRTDPNYALGHRGLSLMLVEKPASEGHEFSFVQPNGGKLSGRAIATIGYRGMHSFDLSFENFFVPPTHVIGEASGLGKGFYLTMAGMVGGRMQTAARSSGVMRAAIRSALQYALDRRVFKKPLMDYPLTQSKLVKMAARYAACRQMVYAIASQMDQVNHSSEASSESIAAQASLVKLIACRSAEIVTRDAMQIFGGMGYSEEVSASRFFVDARVLSIFEGAEETLALKVVAKNLLESVIKHPA